MNSRNQPVLLTHPAATNDPLVRAVESAWRNAREKEAHSPSMPVYENERVQRGTGGSPSPNSLQKEQVRATLERLNKASDQLAVVQSWLRTNPDFLLALDESIRKEYQQVERRTNRRALFINALFTIMGVVIGYLLPIIIHLLPIR